MAIRGVLFDVDDTLFDYSGSERAGLTAHLDAESLRDLHPSPTAALACWRQLMEEEYARYVAGEIGFAAQQWARTRRFLGRPDLSEREASAWFARYTERRDAVAEAFPDAAPTLARLAPCYRLGIVSNSGAEVQRRKLAAVGMLGHLGGAFVCFEEYGTAKPAPDIFLAGCAELGLPPQDVAYVGNDYAVDAVGARDAGLRAYWLRRDAPTPAVAAGRPDTEDGIRVLRTLHELPEALST